MLNKVLNTIHKYNMISPGDKILVGFSGGADSLFLMEMLRQLKNEIGFEICAAHLNHGIRGTEAYSDAEFVRQYCCKYDIEFYLKEISIPEISKKLKISEETAGRQERYQFFNEICQLYGVNKIAVAHNMNDSVETIIHNMVRGSSLNGLTGIKSVNNNIIRPILEIKRAEIEEYLKLHKLSFCTDSTNSSDIYTRNKIRNNILKTMTEINDSAVDTIYNNSLHLKDEDEFMNSYVQSLDCITSTNDKIVIDKTIFYKQKIAIKRRIIMKAFELTKGNCKNITSNHIEILCNANTPGKHFDMPDNTFVYVSGTSIIFSVEKIQSSEYCISLGAGDKINCYENIFINAQYCNEFCQNDATSLYLDADKINESTLTVRNRKDGDKFIPYGMNTPKKLKKLLTDLKIPSFEKDKVPIVCDGDIIAGIVPYRVSDLYKVTENTKRILKIYTTKEE